MATWDYVLAEPPTEARAREVWLQHAAGFILCEDVRRHAAGQIDPGLGDEARGAALKAIDDALYGLMQVIDGVTGGLANADHAVAIDFVVRLVARGGPADGRAVAAVDLRDGDGMAMGYHGWVAGDFGADPVVAPRGGDGSQG